MLVTYSVVATYISYLGCSSYFRKLVSYKVVVAESCGSLLGGGSGHPLLLDRDAYRVPEARPDQLLQLLGLGGREQARPPLLWQEGQDNVQTEKEDQTG